MISRVDGDEEVVAGRAGEPVAQVAEPRRTRNLGYAAGRIRIPDDFDEPLTDEELLEWGL